jgi:hypothetical protein
MLNQCEALNYVGAFGILAYSAFEYWIGRTQKVKASSLLELLGIVIGFVIVKLITKGGKDGKGI